MMSFQSWNTGFPNLHNAFHLLKLFKYFWHAILLKSSTLECTASSSDRNIFLARRHFLCDMKFLFYFYGNKENIRMYRKCLLGKKTSSWPRRWFLRDKENIFFISMAMKYFYRNKENVFYITNKTSSFSQENVFFWPSCQ